jgi:hypothetical protein
MEGLVFLLGLEFFNRRSSCLIGFTACSSNTSHVGPIDDSERYGSITLYEVFVGLLGLLFDFRFEAQILILRLQFTRCSSNTSYVLFVRKTER